MVEKKEEDNQQEEIKEPDSENIENEEDNNDSQENTDTEETTEDENIEEDRLEKEIETLKEEKIRLLAEVRKVEGGIVALYQQDAAHGEKTLDRPGPRHRLWMISPGWKYEYDY